MKENEKVYLTTKQITNSGEEIKIVQVAGDTVSDATINARIKMTKAIENFKANKVNYAYVDVRQLNANRPLDFMEWTNASTTTESTSNAEAE